MPACDSLKLSFRFFFSCEIEVTLVKTSNLCVSSWGNHKRVAINTGHWGNRMSVLFKDREFYPNVSSSSKIWEISVSVYRKNKILERMIKCATTLAKFSELWCTYLQNMLKADRPEKRLCEIFIAKYCQYHTTTF